MNIDHPSTGSRLVARDVSLGYGGKPVVDGLSTDVPDGQTTVIVGANACGKSTLLRGMARLLRPSAGAVLLDGHAIATLPSRQVARTLGLLPQNPVTPEGVGVVDLVGSRTPSAPGCLPPLVVARTRALSPRHSS